MPSLPPDLVAWVVSTFVVGMLVYFLHLWLKRNEDRAARLHRNEADVTTIKTHMTDVDGRLENHETRLERLEDRRRE